jgi:hypothetical protein
LKIEHTRDHQEVRAAAYPSVEDQLDMLWHAMDQGTAPKVEPFYSRIKEVKEYYPKQ